VRVLRYLELKTGFEHKGPAWIGYGTPSKTGRTIYFNGRALRKYKGGWDSGNHYDVESGEHFWVSGVKKNGADRHRFGSGKVLIEAEAVPEYLRTVGATELDKARLEITDTIVQTDIKAFERIANTSYRAGETSASGL
jgi:hypothetical protein